MKVVAFVKEYNVCVAAQIRGLDKPVVTYLPLETFDYMNEETDWKTFSRNVAIKLVNVLKSTDVGLELYQNLTDEEKVADGWTTLPQSVQQLLETHHYLCNQYGNYEWIHQEMIDENITEWQDYELVHSYIWIPPSTTAEDIANELFDMEGYYDQVPPSEYPEPLW